MLEMNKGINTMCQTMRGTDKAVLRTVHYSQYASRDKKDTRQKRANHTS